MLRVLLLALILSSDVVVMPARADSEGTPPEVSEGPAPVLPLRVARDVGSGVSLFVHDAWAVASGPARLDRRGALRLGVVLAASGLLLATDEEIDDFVQRNKGRGLLGGVADVGGSVEVFGLMGKTNPYYAGGIVVGYVSGWDWLQRVSTDVLFSHYLAGLVRNGAKVVVGRRRPFEGRGAYAFELQGGTSLPSGHTSTVFQLATVLSHHLDRRSVSWLLYGLATTVAYQRLDSRSHWASDVWIGALSGMSIAKIVMREHDARGFHVVPTVDREGGAGVQVGFRF